jgi:hypothetical protein
MWPKTLARDDRRPLESDGGNIVGAVIIRLVGALLLEQSGRIGPSSAPAT